MANYSIDLAKLGEKDSTWTIGNFGNRDIERVSSHDDGPEDFTLRLADWMRGTMPAKPQANRVSADSAHASEIEALKNELQACRTESQERQNVLKQQLEAQNSTIESLREEQRAKTVATSALITELQQAKEQLTETCRILRNVEDENELLTHENERYAETIGNLQRALDEERLRISDSADAQIAYLQEEIAGFQNEKTTDTIPYSEHRAALDKLQDDHAAATEALATKSKKELNTLRSAIIKAGEGMKKREERLIASHGKETTELKHRNTDLQEKLKAAATPALKQTVPDDENPTVIELRSALNVQQKRLSSANQALRVACAEADEAHQKLKTIKEENDDINREMDEKVQKMMEDREREWRRRIKIMFKERETMAKALMTMWGREECGVAKEGEKQRYRYKYVDQEGKVVA
ncbi:MAG: hypothetical protein L6R39_005349 [Caloplaca ligustica]|nr:MAG: hypothetical protein L6R39_005349 [Caloplaca ligustica]